MHLVAAKVILSICRQQVSYPRAKVVNPAKHCLVYCVCVWHAWLTVSDLCVCFTRGSFIVVMLIRCWMVHSHSVIDQLTTAPFMALEVPVRCLKGHLFVQ